MFKTSGYEAQVCTTSSATVDKFRDFFQPFPDVGKDFAYNARDLGLNILAWRIPWKDEPGELQSMGSQKVRHS